MKLFSDLFLLLVTFLLHVGFSRGEAPTIVWDEDDDLFAIEEDTERSHGVPEIRTASALNYLKDCRRAGFDPMQLACTTCSILPEHLQDICKTCCQSYRSLEKRTKRYKQAILVNTGFPESVQELVRDDVDKILEQKGSTRFHVQDRAEEMGAMAMMGLFQQQPSVIFWFDEPVNIDSDPKELADQADEVTVLKGRGLGRDDTRDMLLTLLPDKETQ